MQARGLNHFHLKCLRQILKPRWQVGIHYTDVLEWTGILSFYAMPRQLHLRWSGRLVWMDDERRPKRLFHEDDATSSRSQGDQIRRYEDTLFTEEPSGDSQQFEMDRDSRELQMRQDTAVIETVAFSVEEELDCGKIMFADDVKFWQVIRSPYDQRVLKDNLHRLQAWSEKWLLDFNVQKCAVLHLRPVNSHSNESLRTYHLKDIRLPAEFSQKDLGVWIQNNLKPTLQCHKAAKNAMGVLHAIKRAFVTFDQDLFGKVYGTLVRPHLEYGKQAWRPWLVKDQACLERVQRRATKLVNGLKSQSYTDRLNCLNLFPLCYRQQRGDLILVSKIMHGLERGLSFEEMFQWHLSPSHRGHSMKLRTTMSRLNLRSEFFTQRVVEKWNALPQSVVEATSLQLFKKRLDDYLCPLFSLDILNLN
ncbi:hypothetical protein SprV_0802496000 [Sparganum proliferum]